MTRANFVSDYTDINDQGYFFRDERRNEKKNGRLSSGNNHQNSCISDNLWLKKKHLTMTVSFER